MLITKLPMKVNGWLIYHMEMGLKNSAIKPAMKDISLKEKRMVMEDSPGKMEWIIKANLKMEICMAREDWRREKLISKEPFKMDSKKKENFEHNLVITLENLKMEKCMIQQVNSSGSMEKFMREDLLSDSFMAEVIFFTQINNKLLENGKEGKICKLMKSEKKK